VRAERRARGKELARRWCDERKGKEVWAEGEVKGIVEGSTERGVTERGV
jgi:hypothetical protein